jgi:hypothetical protein
MPNDYDDELIGTEELDADGNPLPKKGKVAAGFGDDDDLDLNDPENDFFDLGLNLDAGGGDDDAW